MSKSRTPEPTDSGEPELGSPLYRISAMVDRAATSDTEYAVPGLSDETKFKVGAEFVRHSAAYMRARAEYPTSPVELCRAEYDILALALQIASMLVTINCESEDMPKARKYAVDCLNEIVDEIRDNEKHPLRGQIISACISSILLTSREKLDDE